MRYSLLVLLFTLALATNLKAQRQFDFKVPPLYLDKNKVAFIKFHVMSQFWLRYLDHNPGSIFFGEPINRAADISIRRFRLGLSGQITPRLNFYFQMGLNNLNIRTDPSSRFALLDALAQYKVSSFLYLGIGKSLIRGLSRFSSPSTSTLVSGDIVLVALPGLVVFDDLIRKFSFWGRGKIGPIDYRLVVGQPIGVAPATSNSTLTEGIAVWAPDRFRINTSFYAKWEFAEKESPISTSHIGTYFGRKKVINLGAGFEIQKDAMWYLQAGDTLFTNLITWSLDFFMDLPLSRSQAFTLYAGYFNYDMGPNYIRVLGVNNPATGIDPGQATFNRSGNAYPTLGTGQTLYMQLAYLTPLLSQTKRLGQFQPFFSWQYANLDRLNSASWYMDLGSHWVFSTSGSRLSFYFQNRPIFVEIEDQIKAEDRKWMAVVQYQIRID